MSTITDIYEAYKIMPQLQAHQLRVAAVAKQVCDSLDIEVHTERIITTCLIHDMGNIIKFNLTLFPEFNEPKGLEYWESVKSEYIEKYGLSEHVASIVIAKDLGVEETVLSNIEAIEFMNWCNVHEKGTLEEKICVYADSRVAPKGIVSLNERLEDGARRYDDLTSDIDGKPNKLYVCIGTIEEEIFAHSKISPEHITSETSDPIIAALKDFSL